jgi:hypothetical protein
MAVGMGCMAAACHDSRLSGTGNIYQEKKRALMMKTDNNFNKLLLLRKIWWQAGLVVAVLLLLAGIAAIALLAYGMFDFFLALPELVRSIAGWCLMLCAAVLALAGLISVLKKSSCHAAEYLDKLAGGKDILSALELQKQYGNASEFKQFLINEVLKNAQQKLKELTPFIVFPWVIIRKKMIFFTTPALIIIVLFLLNPVACKTVLLRIMHPAEDIPPYSRLQFFITPAQPSVIYGQDIEIKVNIEGDVLQKQVFFITRSNTGKIIASPCFHENGNAFIQRLEKVTVPVQFCFQTGRSRSRWHEIKLKLQPLFSSVKIMVTPPRYTGLTPEISFIGPEGVTAMKGSNIELTVVSNRPLSGGDLELQPRSGLEPIKIKGERKAGDALVFKWDVVQPVKAKVRITDIQGSECNVPFEFILNQRLDQEPEVTISEPAQNFMLATPNASIDLAVSASDDLGLKRVDLIKTVNSCKDRIYAIGPDGSDTSFNSSQKLNLADLGVVPGQILEFSAEAFDTNPSLTGYAISEPVKIQIISEEKYAQMLRDRTTFEELSSRYKVLFAKLSSLRRAVDEAKQALDKNITVTEKNELLEKLKNANAQAIAAFKHFSTDFPIYAVEKKHQEVFKEIVAKLEKANEIVTGLAPSQDNGEIRKKLEEVILIMEENRKQYEEIKSQMYEIESFVAVAASAMKFKKIAGKQYNLAQKLKIFTADSAVERLTRLPELAKQQQEIIKELVNAMKELRANANVLSMDYFPLRDSAYKFMEDIEKAKIAELMQQADDFAMNNNGFKAHEKARQAFDLLDELLKKNESFQNLCRGKCSGTGDVGKTCQQILDALMKQMNGKGGNSGEADGGMIGGDPNDGYSNPGTSTLNIPVAGPRRTADDSRKDGTGSEGGLNGSGSGNGQAGRNGRSEKMNIKKYTRTSTESVSLDEVPEQYRQAVKQYLGGTK